MTCPRCGGNLVIAGAGTCPVCSARCAECGRKPAEPGKALCWECRTGAELYGPMSMRAEDARALADRILSLFDTLDPSGRSTVLHGERLLSAIREGVAEGMARHLARNQPKGEES